MATTNRSRILLRAAVPAILAVVGATILYRHVDASSVGPLPPHKQERLDRDAASRGHGRAAKPSDPNTGRPAAGGPVQWDTGIVADDQSPSREYVVRNRWGGEAGGRRLIVFAGGSAAEAVQGIVLVQEVSADGGEGPPRAYPTPAKSGAVRVVSAAGPRLTLMSDGGARFVFNLATLRFE